MENHVKNYIEPNELRLGNFVTHEGETMQVNYKTFELIESFDYFCLEPIPITEDILLKCGFEKVYCSDFTVVLELCPISVKWSKPVNPSMGCGVIYIHDESYKHIQFLHQLQNLFFALTGKELEIKW